MATQPLLEPWRPGLGLYRQMVEAGILEDERVELLDGVITQMSAMNAPHVEALTWLARRAFVATREDEFGVHVQMPLELGEGWVPEPDLAIVPRTAESYASGLPAGAKLVVEVADSSLRKDREVKAPAYAWAGVPELWIVDVHQLVLERHTEPRPQGYGRREDLRGGRVEALEVPGFGIDLEPLWAATTRRPG